GRDPPVLALLGPAAVAVVVAGRPCGPTFAADADLADPTFSAILGSGALHGAVAIAAPVGAEALRLPIRSGPVAFAIAEGLELAGLPFCRHAAVRGRACLDALETICAIVVSRARLIAQLLVQAALALAPRQR